MTKSNLDPENPYRAPLAETRIAVEPAKTCEPLIPFADAQAFFRSVLLILLVPAIYNFFAFDEFFVAKTPPNLRVLYFRTNLGLLITGGVALWFFGYWLFEFLLTIPRQRLFRNRSEGQWRDAIRGSMKVFMYLSFIGAFAWFWWVQAFYSNVNQTASFATTPPSVVSFLLVICALGYLVVQWNKIEPKID